MLLCPTLLHGAPSRLHKLIATSTLMSSHVGALAGLFTRQTTTHPNNTLSNSPNFNNSPGYPTTFRPLARPFCPLILNYLLVLLGLIHHSNMSTHRIEPLTQYPVTILARMATPCVPIYLSVVSAPHTYLVAQPAGQAITFPVLAQHFQFNPPFDQPTHPFGTSPAIANTLADLSSEDLDLLKTSFPSDAGDNVFGQVTDFSMHSTGVSSFNSMFAANPLGFAALNSVSQIPNARDASTQPVGSAQTVIPAYTTTPTAKNLDFYMLNTANESIGGMVWDPQAPDPGLTQGTEQPAASATKSPASSAPGAGLAPTVPHQQSHGISTSHTDQALPVPRDESNYSMPAHPHPHLQVPTPRRSVSAPEMPGRLLPSNSGTLTSTRHSSGSYSPVPPVNRPSITPRPIHRGSTPSTSSCAALLIPLPPTPAHSEQILWLAHFPPRRVVTCQPSAPSNLWLTSTLKRPRLLAHAWALLALPRLAIQLVSRVAIPSPHFRETQAPCTRLCRPPLGKPTPPADRYLQGQLIPFVKHLSPALPLWHMSRLLLSGLPLRVERWRAPFTWKNWVAAMGCPILVTTSPLEPLSKITKGTSLFRIIAFAPLPP